jgi:hypothetical protein
MVLTELSKSLRGAEGKAKAIGQESAPGESILSSLSRAAIAEGYLGGSCSSAADEIDRLLAYYAPRGR